MELAFAGLHRLLAPMLDPRVSGLSRVERLVVMGGVVGLVGAV
jgi:hypothetical protein